MNLPTLVQNDNQDNYNEELNQTLRDGLSDNGWTIPAQTTLKIAEIAALIPAMPAGTLLYDTTTDELKFIGASAVKTVWTPRNLTTANIVIAEPAAALGTIWFDTNISKLKVKTAAGVIETITSV
jgi:hypothetical protein